MSDKDINQVSVLTGTFALLKPAPERTQTGNTRSDSGKKPPQSEDVDMERLAKELNMANQSIGRDLRFRVDTESGRAIIQVLDRETGEIVREIPPEDAKTYVSGMGDVALRLYNGLA